MSQSIPRILAVAAVAAALAIPYAAKADLPGRHPGYLHALTDLRTARWLMARQPGDRNVYADEDVGITEVNAAIQELKRASFEDDKDLHDHAASDTLEHGSRLLRAIEALTQARNDIAQEEDNPEVRALRNRAFEHIDNALHSAKRAHAAWLHDMGR